MAIRNGDIVVFLGDDLTDTPRPTTTNSFPMLVESFLTARYASLRAHYLNVGWSGDTVSRALLRLERDVLSHKPTVVVVCLGLNDAEYMPADPQRLASFRADLTTLVHQCRAAGARVWLISPPSVDEEKGRKVRVQRGSQWSITDLQAIGYNATLSQYAAAIREIAAEQKSGFVDWFGESTAARARGQANDPDAGLTTNGLLPTDRSHAMVAASLLRAWGAQPIQVHIELTWATGDAKANIVTTAQTKPPTDQSPGQPAAAAAIAVSVKPLPIQVQIDATGARKLTLRDVPLPWPMAGGQAGTMAHDWEAAAMCQFKLRVLDAPERGVRIRFDWPHASEPTVLESPISPAVLRAGFNLAGTEALNAAKEVAELFQLIGTKNYYHYGTWRKLALSPPREAELVEAHRKLIEAWNSYVTGTEKLIFNQPHSFDLQLTLTEAMPVEHLPVATPAAINTPPATHTPSATATPPAAAAPPTTATPPTTVAPQTVVTPPPISTPSTPTTPSEPTAAPQPTSAAAP